MEAKGATTLGKVSNRPPQTMDVATFWPPFGTPSMLLNTKLLIGVGGMSEATKLLNEFVS